MSTGYIQLPERGSPSWKSPVTTAAQLPPTGNSLGDARAAEDTGDIWVWNGSAWITGSGGGGGGGTVTSVGLTDSTGLFTISGSPVTTSGNLNIATMSQATTSTNGYLSSTDWNTFNNKQPPGSYLTSLTGDVTTVGSSATLSQAVHKRYVDFISGNDSNTGNLVQPWKTLQHAYNSISPSINEPYVIFISGGNNDSDTPITAKPNVSLTADYLIQISPSFTISGGTTNDGCSFTNILFVGAFSWVRNDNSDIGVSFYSCQFFNGPTVQQNGAGVASVQAFNSTFVNSSWALPNGGFGVFVSCNFLGSTTFADPGPSGLSYLQFDGGYSSGTLTINGPQNPAYFTGFVQDVAFGASVVFVTTANGTPVVEFDSAGLPPTYTGTPTLDYLSFAQYESYTPATPGNWSPTPTQVKQALDQLAAKGNVLVFTSNATAGGAATEAVTVTGLLSTDTIISVSQKTKGGANLPLLGWSTQVTNGITIIYSADMGSGAIVLVAVKR